MAQADTERIVSLAAGTPKADTALTAVDATVIDATYGAPEEAVLNNVRTRLNEVEAILERLGILPAT